MRVCMCVFDLFSSQWLPYVRDIQSRNHSSPLLFTTSTNNSTLLRALSLLLVEVKRLSRDQGGRRGGEEEEEGRKGVRGLFSACILSFDAILGLFWQVSFCQTFGQTAGGLFSACILLIFFSWAWCIESGGTSGWVRVGCGGGRVTITLMMYLSTADLKENWFLLFSN